MDAGSPLSARPAVAAGGRAVTASTAPDEMRCEVDAACRVRRMGSGVAAALGVAPGHAEGRILREAGDPAALDGLDRLCQDVQRTGNLLRCLVTGVDGATRYEAVLAPVRSGWCGAGNTPGVVITLLARAAGVPGAPADPRSPLFAHAPTAIGLVSPTGRWIEVNDALCALTGHDREALRDRSIQDVTVPDDRLADFVYLRQLLAGEISGYELEKRWCRADGEERWVRLVVSACWPEPGAATHLVVQALDVTAIKQAEGRTRLLADLVDSSADAIWARDAGGGIVYWNRAAVELLGYSLEDLTDASSGVDVPPGRVGETAQALAAAAGGRCVGPFDTVRRHRDGHDVEVSVTVSPIVGPDGTLLGFATVARDITERRRDEQALRAVHDELRRRAGDLETLNARLRRSNEDLQQFVFTASHDLSDPLRAITGFIHLLAQTHHGRLDDEADVMIERITDGALRMRQLLDGLLVYSRLGSRPVAAAAVELDGVVDEVVAALDRPIGEAHGAVERGALPVVDGDRAQLVQLLCHLVSNSLVHRSPARHPVIRISADVEPVRVLVHVDDNGTGIAPDQRERVFKMFARLDDGDGHDGTGIGLALVRRIAERHHGTVAAADSPLGGARITVSLPRPADD